MKTLKIKTLLTIVTLTILVASCSLLDDDKEAYDGKIEGTGFISVPSQMDKTGWIVLSGFNEGIVTGNDFTVILNENTVQLISVLDADSRPVLMSIDVTDSKSSTSVINAESTAEALVFLNPFFCTTDLVEAAELKRHISTLNSFNNLVKTINDQHEDGSFVISDDNTALTEALYIVYNDLVKSADEMSYSKSLLTNSSKGFSPYPDFIVNGLSIADYQQSNNELSFKISNEAKRWISVYVDKSTDGTNYIKSSLPDDLIPSPDISIWNIITQGSVMPKQYSRQIKTDITNYKSVAVKCYGLGTHNLINNMNDDDFYRAILPAFCSAVFDLTIPVISVVTGVKLGLNPELRGRPSNDPFYRLVEKMMRNFAKDLVFKAKLYKWYREGDITKIAGGIVKEVFKTCGDEPSLIADIITLKAGREVARATVNSWLFPIRLINASITSINIVVSLCSILSTEAITDFKFENNPADLPVTVYGCIKSYSNKQPVAGASVTSYDGAGNFQQGTISDENGNYTLKANSGLVRIRVVSYGNKATNQTLMIPADILDQYPSDFYAPITWVSEHSSETGNVTGSVVNAINLNPVSDVTVALRPGENETNQEVIIEVKSDNNGMFSFNDIPSGTYTAYFSKEGYISDFIVLSVLGRMTTSDFSMNLSPDIRTERGYRIILSWGAHPEDLDSHIFTPSISGYNYHIYYADKGDLYHLPFISLDVDDISSYGPETITIEKTYTGKYYYSVHHYSGYGNLAGSNATVSLYGINGFIRSWSVPTSGNDRWWNVFSIDGNTGQIENINEISYSGPGEYKGAAKEDVKKGK